jgi:hypothetical protein
MPARIPGCLPLPDDAGLCVDAFEGLPGVDTAYYATQFGYPKSDDNNVRALLEQMQHIWTTGARPLVSTLVAVRSADDPEPLIAVGRVVGQIARKPVGIQRFWFRPGDVDPRVWDKTFAQLPTEVKNAQQPPGPCGARHGGADAGALAGCHDSDSTGRQSTQDAAVVHDITHYMRPGTLQLAALPPLSLYMHLPWCIEKMPLLRFQFA